jgi:hypothetical protein
LRTRLREWVSLVGVEQKADIWENLPGTVSKRVSISPYPSVSTIVGKKYWNV